MGLFQWFSQPNHVQLLTESFSIKEKGLPKSSCALPNLVQIDIGSPIQHPHAHTYSVYAIHVNTNSSGIFPNPQTPSSTTKKTTPKRKNKSRNHGNKK